jgi:hypothetical protein
MAKNDSVWSIDELVALTDDIQEGEVEFKGKTFSFQYSELTEKEEPKMVPLEDGASLEEQTDWYQTVGSERILAMMKKAYDKNPEGECLEQESWSKLPATLRYKVIAEVLSIEGAMKGNFPSG